MPMQRTQIYLEPELAASLDRIARQRGTSRADLIRTAARQLVSQENETQFGSILSLAGIGCDKDGATDVAERHDKYLADAEFAKWQR
jgi:metal-responsive CopG/Arc/MetJ family transcriptional regulator